MKHMTTAKASYIVRQWEEEGTEESCPFCSYSGQPHDDGCLVLEALAFLDEYTQSVQQATSVPMGLTPEEEAWYRQEAASPIVDTTNTAETVAKLRAERDAALERARKAEARESLHKDTAALYDMQFRLERENSQLLYHTLQRHAPEALKEITPRLNHSNTELDKVLGEYTRRLERLTLALATIRDAETLEECRSVARETLESVE